MKVSNNNRQSDAGLPFAVAAVLFAIYGPVFFGSFEPWRIMPALLITSFLALFAVALAFEGVRS